MKFRPQWIHLKSNYTAKERINILGERTEEIIQTKSQKQKDGNTQERT